MRVRFGMFAVFAACLSSPAPAQERTTTVLGRVVDSESQPMSGVLVFVDGGPGSATTGAVGAFRLEGVPTGTHLLNFRKAGFAPRTFNLVFAPNEDRRDVGAVMLEEGPPPTATLTGTVTDGASGDPLGGAVVKLNGDVVALTDGDGVFLLSDVAIAWGSNDFEVGRFAFTALTDELWIVNPNETFDFSVTLAPIPIEVGGVAAVVVAAPRVATRLQPFYERLESGAGQFITRSDIVARDPSQLTDILRGVAGLRLRPGVNGMEILFSRRTVTFDFGNAADPECLSPLIYLDGLFMGGGNVYVNVNNLADPEVVEGIELYNGTARIPVELSRAGSACGVIGIWTR